MAKQSPEIRNKAPAFTLPDQDGRELVRSSLLGQWAVRYCYPKEDTPGCTKEACKCTSALKDFGKLGACMDRTQ